MYFNRTKINEATLDFMTNHIGYSAVALTIRNELIKRLDEDEELHNCFSECEFLKAIFDILASHIITMDSRGAAEFVVYLVKGEEIE